MSRGACVSGVTCVSAEGASRPERSSQNTDSRVPCQGLDTHHLSWSPREFLTQTRSGVPATDQGALGVSVPA